MSKLKVVEQEAGTVINRSRTKWQVKWESFSKKKATDALANVNGWDRKTDEAHVWALRETMNQGLWDTFNPGQVPIAFSVQGGRLNGKHRLQAFVGSKLDVLTFPVIRGLDPADVAKFDQGLKIRVKAAAHPGRKSVTRDLSRINAFIGLLSGKRRTMISGPLADFYMEQKYREDIEWAAKIFKDNRGPYRAAYCVAFMYVRRADEAFATKVATEWAVPNAAGNLSAPLRRLLMEAERGEGKARTRVEAATATRRTINALAMLHRNEPVTKKRVTDSLNGLHYFSSLLKDGVAKRWDKELRASATEA